MSNLPQKGDRVRVTGVMANEPNPIPVGLEGTVVFANEAQIRVDWDLTEQGEKRGLALLPEDPYEVIT